MEGRSAHVCLSTVKSCLTTLRLSSLFPSSLCLSSLYLSTVCLSSLCLPSLYLSGLLSVNSLSVKCLSVKFFFCQIQCLGSGSGSTKICGSTDPNPRGKISNKNCKKNFFTLEIQKLYRDYKNFLISEWFINFRIKICEKNKTKILKIIFR